LKASAGQARWQKLNEAFGEGWEKECFSLPQPVVFSSRAAR